MADTVEAVIKRILRAVYNDPNITAISDNDDSAWLLDRMNEALIALRTLQPQSEIANGSVTITPSTRLFALPSNLDPTDIQPFSFQCQRTSPQVRPYRLEVVRLETLHTLNTEYRTTESTRISHVYYEDGQLGVYPLLKAGEANMAITFLYPDVFTRLEALTDVIGYTPLWVLYIEKRATLLYQSEKALGNASVTGQEVDDLWAMCVAKAAATQKVRIRGNKNYRYQGR